MSTPISPQLAAQISEARADADRLATMVEESLRSGRYADALPIVEQLFRIDENHDRRYSLYALTLAKHGRFTEAMKAVDRYQYLYGETAALLILRGDIAREQKREAKAEESFRRAAELSPNDPRALDRLLHALQGAERGEAMKRLSAHKEAWLPQIWLGILKLDALDFPAAEQLFEEASARAVSEPRALALIVSELSRVGLDEAALRIVAPHAPTPTPVVLAVALMKAAYASNRRDLVASWLPAIENDPVAAEAVAFYRQFLEPAAAFDGEELLRKVALLARSETWRNRDRCYRQLVKSDVLVAVDAPACGIDRSLTRRSSLFAPPLLTRLTQQLQRVALAFTDLEARARWRGTGSVIRLPFRELARRALGEGLQVALNPAGPSSLELHRQELELLAKGEIPQLGESELAPRRTWWLLEPWGRVPPDKALEVLRDQIAPYRDIIEAYFLQRVTERNETEKAVALVFAPGTAASDRNEAIHDMNDPVIHPATARKVRFFEVDDPQLMARIREIGIWLIEV